VESFALCALLYVLKFYAPKLLKRSLECVILRLSMCFSQADYMEKRKWGQETDRTKAQNPAQRGIEGPPCSQIHFFL